MEIKNNTKGLYRKIFFLILRISLKLNIRTGPFKILQPGNQEIGEFDVVQKRRETDFKASKL